MKIVLFHYHLNPGGVTRIIESQIDALQMLPEKPQLLVLTGSCENKGFFARRGVELVEHAELNYLISDDSDNKLRLENIEKIIRGVCAKDDILHFHNLNLGKNPLVSLVVSDLALEGFTLINHAHDFSEDRPMNQSFLQKIIENEFDRTLDHVLYPQVENYHFAVLNSFDHARLIKYGVSSQRCNLFANPVEFTSSLPEGDEEQWREEICSSLDIDPRKMIVTYPVRVIRRKNIGEYVLLAVLFAEQANWLVTQPPKNPVEIELYDKWKAFCAVEQINVGWEAGMKVDFEKLLRVSDFCFTTSIQEGFGMVYMEPWLLGTAVKGRDIPMVTKDLKQSGVQYPLLYSKLILPNGKQLHELDIEQQFKAIRDINNESESKKKLLESNPIIKELLNHVPKELINENNKVILEEYSLKSYGEKLDGLYKRIIK